jgi:hypothetical protein
MECPSSPGEVAAHQKLIGFTESERDAFNELGDVVYTLEENDGDFVVNITEWAGYFLLDNGYRGIDAYHFTGHVEQYVSCMETIEYYFRVYDDCVQDARKLYYGEE